MSRMRAKIGTRETRCHGPWSACSTGPTGPTAAARAPFTGPSFSASAFTDNELRVPFLRGLQIPCSSNGIEIAVFTGEVHRSEEHTSELQSQSNLVCRLLLAS